MRTVRNANFTLFLTFSLIIIFCLALVYTYSNVVRLKGSLREATARFELDISQLRQQIEVYKWLNLQDI